MFLRPEVAEDGSNDDACQNELFDGRNVRSPVGVPRKYQPSESAQHALFHVELSEFAGPLDLLLYLIRHHNLDVLDIPIAFITEKYVAMLEALSELPIDVAAEFLLVAAELAHIKSKMLLPANEGVAVDADDEPDDSDPRADLVRRLLEYQKYRDAAALLSDRRQLGRDVFARLQPGVEDVHAAETEAGGLSIFRLVEAMADVLKKLEPQIKHEVIVETVSIGEQIRFLLDFLGQKGDRAGFFELFSQLASRRQMLMTFLATLELAKAGVVRIEQATDNAEQLDEIVVVLAKKDPNDAAWNPDMPTTSVSDESLDHSDT